MLIDKIKADALAARKSSDKFRASVLILLIGECERIAKNATDEEVNSVGRKIIKSLKQTMEFNEAEEASLKATEEFNILSEYFPEEEVLSMETVAQSIIALNPDKEINDKSIGWFVGQVMKATKGHYKIDEVKQWFMAQ